MHPHSVIPLKLRPPVAASFEACREGSAGLLGIQTSVRQGIAASGDARAKIGSLSQGKSRFTVPTTAVDTSSARSRSLRYEICYQPDGTHNPQ